MCTYATSVKQLQILTKNVVIHLFLYPFRALAAYVHLAGSKAICELLLKKIEEKERRKEKREGKPPKKLTTENLPAQLHVRSYVFSLGNIFARI